MKNRSIPKESLDHTADSSRNSAFDSLGRNIRKAILPVLLVAGAIGSHVANDALRNAGEDNPSVKEAMKTLDLMDFMMGTPTHDNYYNWHTMHKEPYPYNWD